MLFIRCSAWPKRPPLPSTFPLPLWFQPINDRPFQTLFLAHPTQSLRRYTPISGGASPKIPPLFPWVDTSLFTLNPAVLFVASQTPNPATECFSQPPDFPSRQPSSHRCLESIHFRFALLLPTRVPPLFCPPSAPPTLSIFRRGCRSDSLFFAESLDLH